MTSFRYLAMLAVFLTTGLSGAWAQLPSISMRGGSFSIDGLKLTVSGCTITGGSYTSSSCAGDELVATSGNRGGITFQIQNYGGTASAALDDTSSHHTVTMAYTIVVADNSSSKVVIGATETLIGENNISVGTCLRSCSTPGATGSSLFSVTASPNPLVDTLAVLGTNPQTAPVNSSTLNSNSFTLSETLSLNAGGFTNGGLKINTLALHFTTTPEPASITIMALGLGGLAVARRRRRAS